MLLCPIPRYCIQLLTTIVFIPFMFSSKIEFPDYGIPEEKRRRRQSLFNSWSVVCSPRVKTVPWNAAQCKNSDLPPLGAFWLIDPGTLRLGSLSYLVAFLTYINPTWRFFGYLSEKKKFLIKLVPRVVKKKILGTKVKKTFFAQISKILFSGISIRQKYDRNDHVRPWQASWRR